MPSVGRIIAIISGCIMIVACALYIVCNVIPRWGTRTIVFGTSIVGLWQRCDSNSGITLCVNFPSTCFHEIPFFFTLCNKIIVSRAFIIIASIISALSALCLFAFAVIRTDLNRIVMIISKILPILSFVAGVIGVVVGIVFVTTYPLNYNISVMSIIGIIAVVVNMIGAILALMVR